MLQHLNPVPTDPLLGIIERFRAETNPRKIDLGVGIYKDENGETPVLASLKKAEEKLLATQMSKAYVGAMGNQTFSKLLCEMALGEDLYGSVSERLAILQTPGGCGALRVAGELIARADGQATLWASDPTWANHIPLLGDAGISIKSYPYYDYASQSIRFDEMLAALNSAESGDLVLLHACCHNPSGADLSEVQWDQVLEVVLARELVPFVDMAYQGFGRGLEEDAYGMRLMAQQCKEVVFAISCSKNFGLYRDRVGMVGVLCESSKSAKISSGHLTQIVRGIYSMPPDHGASVVEIVLSDAELKAEWMSELAHMRERIQGMRKSVAERMRALLGEERFSFVENESGMFSFLGISPEQVEQMAERFGIYMAGSSRINVAGLNSNNIDYFCSSLADVVGVP